MEPLLDCVFLIVMGVFILLVASLAQKLLLGSCLTLCAATKWALHDSVSVCE